MYGSETSWLFFGQGQGQGTCWSLVTTLWRGVRSTECRLVVCFSHTPRTSMESQVWYFHQVVPGQVNAVTAWLCGNTSICWSAVTSGGSASVSCAADIDLWSSADIARSFYWSAPDIGSCGGVVWCEIRLSPATPIPELGSWMERRLSSLAWERTEKAHWKGLPIQLHL